jgi:hypothetical protein
MGAKDRRLYHGTDAKTAARILSDGLLPRHRTGKSVWTHTVESNDTCVYLTECYPGYYAWETCAADGKCWGIVEVDLNRLDVALLRPDEDFLEMRSRAVSDTDVIGRTAEFAGRLDEHAALWESSLERLGSCAYRGAVAVDAISAVAVFDPRANLFVQDQCGLIVVSVERHSAQRERHKDLSRWFFNEALPADWQAERRPTVEERALLDSFAGVTRLR